MTDEPIHKREDVEVENKATSLPEAEIARMTDDIVAALKTVYDPEIPADIYELGLIYKVDIEDDRSVKVEMTLTTPNCPSAAELPIMEVSGSSSCSTAVRCSSSARAALTTSAGTLTAVTDNGNGSYTATLTTPATPGTLTISATLGGNALTATATITTSIGSASLTQSTLVANPTAVTVGGTSTITVQLRDASGNVLTTSGGLVALSASSGSLSAVTDHSNGTYSATLTAPTTPGTITVSGTLAGNALTATATVAASDVRSRTETCSRSVPRP